MKIPVLVLVTILFSAVSCKQKEEPEEAAQKFISVKSLIEEQVAHVDTSLYSIRQITIRDSTHTDTTYIPREKFRDAASEFLSIPDLSESKIAKRFTQDTRYDTLLKRVMITYTPIEPKNEEVKKQEILVSTELDSKGNNKISSIIIEKSRLDRNGVWGQKMLWVIDQYFIITTLTERPGDQETVTVTKVIWNEDE